MEIGKLACISIIILLLSTTILARDYSIDSFPKCYADLGIRVEAPPNNTFEVKPCGLTQPYAKCPCKKNTTYYLSVPDNASGNFNVFITYYIGKVKDELNERTNTYFIRVEPLVPPKEPFNANPIVLITLFVLIILIFVGGIIFLIVKKIKNDDD